MDIHILKEKRGFLYSPHEAAESFLGAKGERILQHLRGAL